ncbi:hypothetical protein [Caudoviricetes sp.]|nr:hypothetical protein [Caudoviricetes sp.]
MLTIALALALAAPSTQPMKKWVKNTRVSKTPAFFEAFASNGRGTFGPCSTTAPTGAKGETLTFARASNGACTKTATGGLATTGIADGDLVVLSSNQPRVEYDSQGVLGLLVEASRQNVLVRYIEYANAAWADVGTPTLTGSQTDPFGATNAVQFDDNDGAAYEGRSQSVTVSAGAAYTAHCDVKAGTLAEARITLDGTANTITGLSSTTWSVIEVTDASSSGVSIAFQALNGDATGDTGTVIWGGCQVEAGSYRTSIIPTTSAAVTRSAETASFAPPWPSSVSISIAGNFVGPTPATGSAAALGEFTALASLLNESGGVWRWFTGGLGQTVSIVSTTSGIRFYGYHDGAVRGLGFGANTAGPTADADGNNKFGTDYYVSGVGGGGTPANGIVSRICVDPNPSRCR